MIVVAVTIAIMYIRPTITEIRSIEDTTAEHKREITEVSDVNESLRIKLAAIDDIDTSDSASLLRYLPDSLDEIEVMKDIIAIFAAVDVTVKDIKYAKPLAVSGSAESESETVIKDPLDGLAQHIFSVTADLDSSQLMNLLNALEINNYLLQVSALKVNPTETNNLSVEMDLTAFSRAILLPESE